MPSEGTDGEDGNSKAPGSPRGNDSSLPYREVAEGFSGTWILGFTWGSERSVLRATADSVGDCRYMRKRSGGDCRGLIQSADSVSTGSGAYGQSLRKSDTGIIDVTAIRILGAGRTARLSTLHAAAGAMSMPNLYLQRIAGILDSEMPAAGSPIQTRQRAQAGRALQIPPWTSRGEIFPAPATIGARICGNQSCNIDVCEEWVFSILPRPHAIARRTLRAVCVLH